MQICGQVIHSLASWASLANHQSLKMQLLCTCGILVSVVLFLVSLSSLQATAWSGWGCSTRNHRGCCYIVQNPMRLRPPCAPKLAKALE